MAANKWVLTWTLKPWPRPMALAFQKVRPRPKSTQANTLAWLGLAWLGFRLQAKAKAALNDQSTKVRQPAWEVQIKCGFYVIFGHNE